MTLSTNVTRELPVAIERSFDAAIRSVSVERSQFSTSHPIDDVDVVFADGSTARLVRKDLAPDALLPAARGVKPAFVHDRRREPGVYTAILAAADLGTAACLGVMHDEGAPRWLLLERVEGVELYQVGDVGRWQSAARWAARLHRRFADKVDDLERGDVPLLRRDELWVLLWARRAAWRLARTDDPRLARILGLVPRLAARYASLPRTFVHGELYASNVIVGALGTDRVCAVDWEMASIAPGFADLASLTAGSGWSANGRQSIEQAYCDAYGIRRDDQFVETLGVCRLAEAIQWLGWSPGWRAPVEHRQDWIAEAIATADRIGW
jgi:hypothetical protein